MAVTTQTLETLQEDILAAISNAIADPKPTYRVGERHFDWNNWLEYHRKLLKDVNEMLSNRPCEEETIYDDPTL